MLRALPELPDTIEPLADQDLNRLRQQYSDLWINPRRTCRTCKKQGDFLAPDGRTECNCVDQWNLHLNLLNAGIGLLYQRLTWDDVATVPSEVIKVVQDYAFEASRYADAGIGMILWGDKGTGKTLLSCLLLKQLIGEGYDGYFTLFRELLDSYTSTWRNEDERRWFTRRIRNAGILVVDDIGKESKGRENITAPMLEDVIRHRVANMKPTIVTTNYTMDEIRQGYSTGVLDLLSERCIPLEVTGENFRERSRVRNLDETTRGVTRPIALG